MPCFSKSHKGPETVNSLLHSLDLATTDVVGGDTKCLTEEEAAFIRNVVRQMSRKTLSKKHTGRIPTHDNILRLWFLIVDTMDKETANLVLARMIGRRPPVVLDPKPWDSPPFSRCWERNWNYYAMEHLYSIWDDAKERDNNFCHDKLSNDATEQEFVPAVPTAEASLDHGSLSPQTASATSKAVASTKAEFLSSMAVTCCRTVHESCAKASLLYQSLCASVGIVCTVLGIALPNESMPKDEQKMNTTDQAQPSTSQQLCNKGTRHSHLTPPDPGKVDCAGPALESMSSPEVECGLNNNDPTQSASTLASEHELSSDDQELSDTTEHAELGQDTVRLCHHKLSIGVTEGLPEYGQDLVDESATASQLYQSLMKFHDSGYATEGEEESLDNLSKSTASAKAALLTTYLDSLALNTDTSNLDSLRQRLQLCKSGYPSEEEEDSLHQSPTVPELLHKHRAVLRTVSSPCLTSGGGYPLHCQAGKVRANGKGSN
eukprot:GHVQ01012363.1.p1 GENE.GHVQ01012363.1~~GHVQ01012363.1.p1  ORF type:complete len:545 (-),score=72.39 GHVQ01012363.1:629-2098(-)